MRTRTPLWDYIVYVVLCSSTHNIHTLPSPDLTRGLLQFFVVVVVHRVECFDDLVVRVEVFDLISEQSRIVWGRFFGGYNFQNYAMLFQLLITGPCFFPTVHARYALHGCINILSDCIEKYILSYPLLIHFHSDFVVLDISCLLPFYYSDLHHHTH